MSTLQTEWERLYQLPDPLADDGRVRALVVELGRPADWASLAGVWRGVQADWEFPAPAIAVNGCDGHQLWFSLAQPVRLEDAQAFLEGLRTRYLPELASARVRLLPNAQGQAAQPVPALQDSGQWSAFVTPDLAAIFSDEPWLDRPPSVEGQAKLLASLRSVASDAFAAALQAMRAAAAPATPPLRPSAGALVQAGGHAPNAEPNAYAFLQSVMNDPSVAMPLRIEAAKALLPFGKP